LRLKEVAERLTAGINAGDVEVLDYVNAGINRPDGLGRALVNVLDRIEQIVTVNDPTPGLSLGT
jgi:hypothetical protein